MPYRKLFCRIHIGKIEVVLVSLGIGMIDLSGKTKVLAVEKLDGLLLI